MVLSNLHLVLKILLRKVTEVYLTWYIKGEKLSNIENNLALVLEKRLIIH